MSSAVLIMPLGDSITEGFSDVEGFSAETSDGGYRGPLFRMLVDAGFPIAFVGTADPVKDRPYGNWEGHGGWHATQIKDGISGFLVASRPDVVLLHIGTNDIHNNNNKASDITKEVERILNKIDDYERASHARVTVILAKIIDNFNSFAEAVETAEPNRLIEAMAAARIAAGDRLVVVDFGKVHSFPDFSGVGLNVVQVHANASGYPKMARVWFEAVSRVLSNRIIPAGGYTLDILTGLAVDQNGILEMTSVVDLEFWQPLVPISGPIFTPGAPVAMAKQTDGILTALAVDKDGRLVVTSVAGAGLWQEHPVGISQTIFLPGTPVAAKQTDGILTALAVDRDGRLRVTSVAGPGDWKQPPVGISDTIFLAGHAGSDGEADRGHTDRVGGGQRWSSAGHLSP